MELDEALNKRERRAELKADLKKVYDEIEHYLVKLDGLEGDAYTELDDIKLSDKIHGAGDKVVYALEELELIIDRLN